MFYIAILFWIVMLVAAGAALIVPGKNDRSRNVSGPGKAGWAGIAVLCLVLGLGAFAWSGVKSVPAKSVGVPVSLGHVGKGFYTSGAHETWDPFLHLAIIDETIQTVTFENGSNLPGTSQCHGELPIRIGGQQPACAKVTIQYRVKSGAAGSLFSDYANHSDLMNTIQNALVVRELEVVVNNQLGDYDPITDYQTVVNTRTNTSQFTQFGPDILRTMKDDIGSQVQVIAVFLPRITYSSSIEANLIKIQTAYTNATIATENEKVNAANAKAYNALGNPTVNQLVAQCLKDVEANHGSPMGCFPGQASGLQLSK
jgi:regulator of protease activity HflC (stomatin/prohibitin superfamily)